VRGYVWDDDWRGQ